MVQASPPASVRRQPRGERAAGREPIRSGHGVPGKTRVALQRVGHGRRGAPAVGPQDRDATGHHVGSGVHGPRRVRLEVQHDGTPVVRRFCLPTDLPLTRAYAWEIFRDLHDRKRNNRTGC